MKVLFFSNGNTACFDENDKQIPHLQKSWVGLFCDLLNKHGIKPEKVEFTLPDGKMAEVFHTEFGWNWAVKNRGK